MVKPRAFSEFVEHLSGLPPADKALLRLRQEYGLKDNFPVFFRAPRERVFAGLQSVGFEPHADPLPQPDALLLLHRQTGTVLKLPATSSAESFTLTIHPGYGLTGELATLPRTPAKHLDHDALVGAGMIETLKGFLEFAKRERVQVEFNIRAHPRDVDRSVRVVHKPPMVRKPRA